MKKLMFQVFGVMSIMVFAALILACVSPAPPRSAPTPARPAAPPPPSIEHWWMDVTITSVGRLAGSVQRVRFFRNLRDLEAATGLPFHVNQQGAARYQWRWGGDPVVYDSDSHDAIIFSVMRREGFGAAFVLTGSGTDIHGQPWRTYSVYRISNGREFFAGSTTRRPVW